MKTDFEIRVHVELGVTPELTQLVRSIIGSHTVKEPVVDAPDTLTEIEQTVEEPATKQPRGERKRRSPKTTEKVEEQPAEAPAEEQPEETPEAPEAPTQEPKPEAQKELTEQDIREAMDKTRKRIEGEDYKDNTESEGYQKYHRQLTSAFKNIAALLGAEKPSALPAEQRMAFITECDLLKVMEDGTIGKIEAF